MAPKKSTTPAPSKKVSDENTVAYLHTAKGNVALSEVPTDEEKFAHLSFVNHPTHQGSVPVFIEK